MRTSVDAGEVQELLHGCTAELKSRGMDVIIILPLSVMHHSIVIGLVLHRLISLLCDSSGYAVSPPTLSPHFRSQRCAYLYQTFLRSESASLW